MGSGEYELIEAAVAAGLLHQDRAVFATLLGF
jgi:delta-aminolevulinic acid dehydratase/porphobilinogen synthase